MLRCGYGVLCTELATHAACSALDNKLRPTPHVHISCRVLEVIAPFNERRSLTLQELLQMPPKRGWLRHAMVLHKTEHVIA
jgi:hypothetical protein